MSNSPAISDQRLIPFIVGSVLLTAALLKAHAIWSDSSFSSAISGSTLFQVVLVEAELACGLALWFGLSPRVTRYAALLMFACFLGAALSQVFSGARSCACFGKVEFHPWLAVALDGGMLILLWWAPRRLDNAAPRILSSSYLHAIHFGVLLIFPATLFAIGRSENYPRVNGSPAIVDLRSLQQGGRRTFAMRLRNPHAKEVTIRHVNSSCRCLKANGLPWTVAPFQEKTVEYVLDLAEEPEFVGRLLIDFRGRTWDEATTFAATVQVSVVGSRMFAGVSK